MNCAATILADVDDIIHVVVVVVFLIIAAVASLLQKTAQKRRAEQAEAQRRASPEPQRQAPSGAQRQPPPRPPTPAEEITRAMREALGLGPQRPTPTPPPREVPPREAETARPTLTAQEPQQRRAGRRGKLQRRRARPTTLQPSEGLAGEGTRISRARVEARPPPTLEPLRGKLNLDNVQQARRAIVFHEIFSSPKALRKGSEMWDL